MGKAYGAPWKLIGSQILDQLPPELVQLLRNASGNGLDELSLAALQPSYTSRVLVSLEPIFVGLAARWFSLDPGLYSIPVVSAFSRVLPVAPYLRCFVLTYLEQYKRELPFISGTGHPNLHEIDEKSLLELLQALFRLLSFDLDAFSHHVRPIQLQSLFTHENGTIRYLSIRCFGLYMQAADAVMQKLLSKYHGDNPIHGEWEGQSIDYRYLGLREEKRWKTLKIELDASRKSASYSDFLPSIRQLRNADYVAQVGDVLVPTVRRHQPTQSVLVKTSTTTGNLRKLGYSLLTPDSILLIGPPGSGKTSCVVHAAREMGQVSSMITLHLNEQTDSKSLLGVYSTSPESGGFAWQPGVLTKAAKEGRWVLIEDLDRAPAEVMGLILPLIENRELVIPSRKEHIRCAEGFRIIATMKSSLNSRGEEVAPDRAILGSRLWRRVWVASMPLEEIKTLIGEQFPLISLSRFADVFLKIYERMELALQSSVSRKSTQGRHLGLRDLMKFCWRVERRLKQIGVEVGKETVPERTVDEVFLDAVDCFATYLSSESLKSTLIGVIAEELNMSPQRMHFCLSDRVPTYSDEPNSLTIGREVCPKIALSSGQGSGSWANQGSPFATTKVSLRTMEQVVAALQVSEPMLLVGETGIGKTAVIQRLATLLRQRLTVVNLSQQSETTDLLGGYKPVNLRSIAVSMVDDFTSLFESTFSAKKNQKFLSSVSKSVANGNWLRLVNILKEAVKMASGVFGSTEPSDDGQNGTDAEQPSKKKRRLNSPRYSALRQRWETFASELAEFQTRVSQDDSKFSFAFVQGKIVKALRNGEWVLLDEINLASPDTLESIASLLDDARDGGPSVLLSEAGDVERVFGNPNFRIFGAMNPATDAGKRDLAPALRSRFTELYVQSPDSETDDLLTLIESYLGALVSHDRMAPSALANLYLETKKMTAENKLVDGAGQKPHFSVRTLVRTLLYVRDQAHVYGLRRAIYEGFCMSFLTLLSKDSERQVIPLLDRHIFGSVRNSRSILAQTPREPTDGTSHVQFKHYWMQRGNFTPETQPHYVITPFIERNLLNLVRASSTRRFPILLQGPTSAGKTSMVEYLAKLSGNRFVRINNHEHTDLQEYLGSYISGEDGSLRYQEGILVEALRHGYWIVLDELNLAPTDVLEALNRLLDDNRELFLPETQEVVRPHQNFMLFATQNPAGLYGGRKVLSRAFRNRFLELHFDDIPEDELEFILKERSQIAPSFCTRIVSVYKKLAILRQSSRLFEQRNSFATLRDLFRWALRRADDRQQLAINGFMLLAERVRKPQEREAVKHVIEKVMGVRLDEKSIYSTGSLEYRISQLNAVLPSGIVWTQAMRRLFILVSEAIEHNEPVLLVGETGCGKTQLCQAIAEAYGKELSVVNAHVNLETGDLIGAQRPLRNRTTIEQQILDDVSQLLPDSSVQHGRDITVDDAKSALNSLPPEELEKRNKSVLERVRTNLTRVKALFEWSDGSLVEAMKSGQFFLLDELSLADDSVLERLNSVMEPQRSILLAEKGPVDSTVVAREGFQFLSTMNPGGDYGKRELSPALRNRLTEIWVPTLSEAEDILPIVESKLTRSRPHEPEAMLEFAKWFKERSAGTGAGAPMSVRDLLAWVNFVNTCDSLDTSSAMVHGACMVYIDSLGANPSAMLAASSDNLENDRLACLEKLSQLFSIDALSIYGDPTNMSVGVNEMTIGPFYIAGGTQPQQDPNFALDAPTTLANSLRIARGLQSNKPILVEGSPGVGKTTLVAALAAVLGQPLTRINLSEQTDLTDLFGSDVPMEGGDVGNFAWSDAPFLRAMQRGGWVLLDEMNLASQSVLEGLNSCLDHRQQVHIAELGQTFQRHPDFVLFAAQNPHHQGGGRKGLPASFVNRFTVVYADSFTVHDLRLICRKLSPHASSERIDRLVNFIFSLNAQLASRRLGVTGAPWEMNLRDLSRWFQLLDRSSSAISPWQFLEVVISQRFRTEEDKALISELYAEMFGEPPGTKNYFHNLGSDSYQVGLGLLQRSYVVQRSPHTQVTVATKDLPAMEALVLCIEQAWPAVLVGPPGSGKTSVLRKLAALAGAKLIGLALNSDTDAMDLVGGFEQRDIQRQLSAFVKDLCGYLRSHILLEYSMPQTPDVLGPSVELYQKLGAGEFQFEAVLESLRSMSQLLETDKVRDFYETCLSLFQLSRETNKVGFEWTDGLLVDAMQRGDWVVLDNANLCDSSVLDRLNSLMEPDGCLIINEQRTPDGSAKIVKPHPNFRLFLTMDPRFGELSRAMRNRGVEIFMPPRYDSDLSQDSPVTYTCESSLYRLRQLQNVDWSQAPRDCGDVVVDTSLDHLSKEDITKADDLLHRLAHGLCSEENKSFALSSIQHYRSLVGNEQFTEWQNMVGTESLDGNSKFSDGGVIEPLHPLVNEPRLYCASTSGVDSLFVWIARLQELQVDLLRLREALANAQASARSKKPSDMNPLELSIVSKTLPPHMKHLARPFAPFLFGCVKVLAEFIQRQDSTMLDRNVPPMINSILQFCWDIFRISQSKNYVEAEFQTYSQIGRTLLCQSKDIASDMISKISHLLDTFRAGWRLTTGLSMQRLWDKWRPATASTLEHLDLLSRLREVCTQFDQVSLNSQMAHSHLGRLRRSLIEAQSSVLLGADADGLVSDLALQISSVKSDAQDVRPISKPYFSDEFEALCQYYDLSGTDNPAHEVFMELLGSLELLAGRPSSPDDISTLGSSIPQLLSRIFRFSGFKNSSFQPLASRGNICLLLLGKLSSLGGVSLNQIDLLTSEIDVISKGFAWATKPISVNQIALLRNKVFFILEQLLICHGDQLEPKLLDDALSFIKNPDRWEIYPGWSGQHQDPGDEGTVQGLLFNVLARAMGSVTKEPRKHERPDGYETGELCIALAMAFIKLFVPDRPFDPSLGLVVERQRYFHQVALGNKRLDGLKYYETFFTGRQSSLRIAVAESNLRDLGNEPPQAAVIRPTDSQFSQLYGEFRNVLGNIANKTVDDIVASAKATGVRIYTDGERESNANLLQKNIRQLCLRLTTGYDAYEDLSIPIVRFLQLLDLGISLVQQNQAELSDQQSLLNEFTKGVPFMGYTNRTEIEANAFLVSDSATTEVAVHRLSSLSVAQNTNPATLHIHSYRSVLTEIISNLYAKWKSQLEQDQAKEAEKSRLYHYKFSDEDELSGESEGMSKLFPTFEGDDDEQGPTESSKVDPKGLSQKLFQFTKDLFTAQDKESTVRRLITDSASLVGKSVSKAPERVTCAAPAAHLSAVLLQLDNANEPSSPELYNFYADPNVVEAKKLVELVGRVLQRFTSIQKSWPEHATLADVISCCLQILHFKQSDPLAKLITKTEQLHTFVNEWQTVASREFSVSDCYDNLTSLIISWRRLELSTWARLLDLEKEKCEADASAWWFVAYEVIIVGPLQIIEASAESDMQTNTCELVNTLQKFIESTQMGQFAFRLQLIERLKSLVDIYAIDFPTLARVSAALNNLVQHYAPFVPVVENVLNQGRQSLEKDIKQEVQLASWKDVNIAALRESARRSHNKLFKVVRKYRELLRQSCDGLLEKGYSSHPYQEEPITRPFISVPNAVPSDVLTVCRENPLWRAKSARFNDPDTTAANMRQVYTTSFVNFEAVERIDLFIRDVIETIKSFRSKTPKTLTEENKEEVQHLKTQKRRFYADTLRDLLHMGFQSNLGTATLNQQSSVGSILATSPSLPLSGKFSKFDSANSYFHRLLDLLPRVRVAGRSYAQDLSNVEAGRSAGFVEGMLSRVLRQREKLKLSLESWALLEILVDQMANISSLQHGELRASNSAAWTRQELQGTLYWLETLLGVCGSVLQIQMRFARSGSSEVLDKLTALKHRSSDVLMALNNAVSLPAGISSESNDGSISQAQRLLQDAKSEITLLSETHPEFAFALKQLLPWAEPSTAVCSPDHDEADTGNSGEAFDHSLTTGVDKIFIALQRLNASLPTGPVSVEDQAWLVNSDQTLSRSIDELHMKDITTSISSALRVLSLVPPNDRNALLFGQVTVAMFFPIVQQYQSICFDLLHRHASLHREMCKMGYLLASSFTQIASEGFCSPAEESNEQGKSDKLEGGTGLGEGGGAEDISKDVQDDEDLTDLAQQKNEADGEQSEMEEAEDAVDMGNEDLEADDKETQAQQQEKDDQGSEGEGDEEEDLDEEVGSVDGLDSSAVDEKLWDGANDEEQKDTENNEGKGSSTDEKTAASEKKTEKEDTKEESKEDDEDAEESDADDEGEAIGREDVEATDPHAKDEDVLDLPDDMQLDGQDNAKESEDDGDDGLDDLSMADNDESEEQQNEQDGATEDKDPETAEQDTEMGEEEGDIQESEEAGENAGEEEEDIGMGEEDQESDLKEREGRDEIEDPENVAPSEAIAAGLGQDQDREQGDSGDATQDRASAKQNEENRQEDGAAAPEGEGMKQDSNEIGGTGNDDMADSQTQAFKKLGDILQEWHRQQRNIKESSQKEQNHEENHGVDRDVDMGSAEFEHLANDEDAPDTQALGQAEEERVKGIDQSMGVESDPRPNEEEFPPNVDGEEDAVEANTLEDQMQIDQSEPSYKQPHQSSSFIANENREGAPPSEGHGENKDREDLDNVDNDLSAIHLSTESGPLTSADEARRLWSHYENATHDLSLSLTEQLRLILAPTMATKLRGDFRTGKRLNIKRIIPYIASQYRRDKIWMRRSVPSKRSYQIMLAVDDSKSMLENESGQLAFQTLALVSKSLSMLEAGDLCIVGFGNEEHIRVAHEFGKPFSSEAGMQVFQQFSYKQTGTNVRKLVADAIALFREAKAKQSSASRTGDLWQLQLIISDGICEDHDVIRRLVRQAQEERIMIVFIIVDAVADESRSIMNLTQASFEPDESGSGDGKWKMKRYLDDFPFPYYLVVRDVQELPGVLSLALKQWFAEVVEVSA